MAVPVAANSQIPTNFGITFYEKVQSKWANWYWVLKKGCLLSHLVFKCPKQSAAVAVQYLGLHNRYHRYPFRKPAFAASFLSLVGHYLELSYSESRFAERLPLGYLDRKFQQVGSFLCLSSMSSIRQTSFKLLC